jgi:hypothetical protein
MTNVPTTPRDIVQSGSDSWTQRLRRLVTPAVALDGKATGSARAGEAAATGVVNVQVWVDQVTWRPAGFWAFVAGLLASGALRQPTDLNWQALALLAILVDPLWGGIWRLSGGRRALLALPSSGQGNGETPGFVLPYMQAGAPAARLLAGDHTDVWPLALRVGAPAVIFGMLVAALLGVYAVGLTGAVVVLAALGWTLRRTFGDSALLLQSVVAIGLPWVLTLQQAPHNEGSFVWLPQLLLAGSWVVHQWGGLRNAQQSDGLGLLALAVAQVLVAAVLIVVQAPLWLAPLAVLLLPTWLLAYQRLPLRRLQLLWLAAMLLSALALGQTVGL